MRFAQVRILIALQAALAAIVGAAVWMVMGTPRLEAVNSQSLQVGAGAIAAVLLLAGLAVWGLVRETKKYRRRMLTQGREWVLATGGNGSAPADAELMQLLTPVRERMETLAGKADSLQIQKKNLEIQLRLADAQRRQSQIMLQGISDAVVITDGFDELLMANPAAAALFAFDLASAAKKPIAGLIGAGAAGVNNGGARLAADISDMRQNYARTNRRTAEYQLDFEGKLRTFSVTLSCVTDNSEQFAGVVAMLHDRTREDEISKMKTEFVSHVSHELRTPLSSIKAYAELLVDGEATDDKTRNEFYHIIQAEADRLSRLIDNILNISRIESGMTRIHKKPVALNGLLKQVLEVAMPSARDKQITVVDQVSPVFFSVDADRDMIYQAALNLVSNAIKYTPSGGTVKVSLSAEDATNELMVLVQDTGVGIPAESMKHLFEKFYRVEQNKNMAKGSGLGLNLTRQLIENIHKGRMIVRSEVGKGSTFGFALPIAA